MAADMRDTSGLRNAWDIIRARMSEPGAIVLASVQNGKPVLFAAGTDQAVEKGFNAGEIIKQIAPAIQGGGGGKATMAQAGGKNVQGIEEALDKARELLL